MTEPELRLRITVEHPPASVAMQVQRGRDELLPPTRSTAESISFDFTVRLGEPRTRGQLRLLGEFTQGPAEARFVYVNSGLRAGQSTTCWDRRAKVALTGITATQIKEVLADPRSVLEARITGTGRDGGPVCGSVPLLRGGWAVKRAKR